MEEEYLIEIPSPISLHEHFPLCIDIVFTKASLKIWERVDMRDIDQRRESIRSFIIKAIQDYAAYPLLKELSLYFTDPLHYISVGIDPFFKDESAYLQSLVELEDTLWITLHDQCVKLKLRYIH
jgi:hypothetical protein